MKPKFLSAVILLLGVVSFSVKAQDQPLGLSQGNAGSIKSPAQPVRRGLSPEEKRGKAFYLRGESLSGQEITAMVGEIEVPATTLTCAGCHGARGEGKTEGGVTAGNVTWSELTKPYGHAHETG